MAAGYHEQQHQSQHFHAKETYFTVLFELTVTCNETIICAPTVLFKSESALVLQDLGAVHTYATLRGARCANKNTRNALPAQRSNTQRMCERPLV